MDDQGDVHPVGETKVTGVIEPGRAADLVVVTGDPLADISDIRDVAVVLREGRLVVDERS